MRLYNPDENKIVISYNVTYDEKSAWKWNPETANLEAVAANLESGTFNVHWTENIRPNTTAVGFNQPTDQSQPWF